MHKLIRILENYCDSGAKHFFRLKSGKEYFGWLFLDIDASTQDRDDTAGYLLFQWAPGPMGDEVELFKDEKVLIQEIDTDSLTYYDEQLQGWVKFEPRHPGQE